MAWIKNNTVGDKTYSGQLITSGTYYEIQDHEKIVWANDSVLLTDIANGDAVVAKGSSSSEEITDVNKAIVFLKELNPVEVDNDGRQVTKSATTYKGWRYLAHSIEVETSMLQGLFSKNWEDNDRGNVEVKFYNDQNEELVAATQLELDNNCVKTEVTFSPTYDYDIIGGNVHQISPPNDDVRLWVIAGACDLKHLPNTVTEFVGGLNLRLISQGNSIETDGRASARLNYSTTGVPVPTNKMQYIFRHPQGYKHKLMIVVEYFRA